MTRPVVKTRGHAVVAPAVRFSQFIMSEGTGIPTMPAGSTLTRAYITYRLTQPDDAGIRAIGVALVVAVQWASTDPPSIPPLPLSFPSDPNTLWWERKFARFGLNQSPMVTVAGKLEGDVIEIKSQRRALPGDGNLFFSFHQLQDGGTSWNAEVGWSIMYYSPPLP